jgi:hypothetical protein
MTSMKCPKCGLINPETALRCDCGYDFQAGDVENGKIERVKRSRDIILLAIFLGWLAVFCIFTASDPGSHILFGDFPWTWGYAIPWLIASVIFAGLAKAAAKAYRIKQQPIKDWKAKEIDADFILLLRPFSADNSISVPNFPRPDTVLLPSHHYEESSLFIERLLAEAVEPAFQLRVLGGSPIGPGVVLTDDANWRSKFRRLAHAATGVVMMPLPGKEIPWQLAELRKEGLLEKTIVVIPSEYYIGSTISEKIAAFWNELRCGGFHFPRPETKDLAIYFDKFGNVTQTIRLGELNDEWLRPMLIRKWGEAWRQEHAKKRHCLAEKERQQREEAEAAWRHAEEERRQREEAEAAQRRAEEERRVEGYTLSLGQAAQAIGVTRATLRDYIKSGRVKTNLDGSIKAVELVRAGFIIRQQLGRGE